MLGIVRAMIVAIVPTMNMDTEIMQDKYSCL